MSLCRFLISWVGPCKAEALPDADFCTKHNGHKCVSCGEPADRDCEATLGPLTCGSYLCPKCMHEGGGFVHVRRAG